MRSLLPFAIAATLAGPVLAQDATQSDAELIERGRYLATAADCAACHRTAEDHGAPFAGGYEIASPMGPIVASNITPSEQYGIGSWSETEFARALRKGVSPSGHLYPAMPYTSYAKMPDADVHAIYAYLMNAVEPVNKAPAGETRLDFPFNQRGLMAGWNLVFNTAAPMPAAQVAEGGAARGEYLVDGLAHCASCHSPRNVLMGEDNGAGYLSGGNVGGWHAPNITSDPVSGIGAWSETEIVDYLRSGSVAGKSQAAGGMAEAVEHSLRHLSDEDLAAMASYLKTVPPVRDPDQQVAAFDRTSYESVSLAALDHPVDRDPTAMTDGRSLDGQDLYMGACASCHQPNGEGTGDQFYPSLTANTATGGMMANNLVLAIANGVHRETNDGVVSMPAFGANAGKPLVGEALSDGQIAAVSNYVLTHFGNPDLQVTEAEVTELRAGGPSPLLMKATPYLLWIALAVLVLAVLALTTALRRRKSTPA